MDLFILKEIAKFDRSVWKLFSLLNKEMNRYFNVKGKEYELCFRTIVKDKIATYYKLNGKCHRSDGPAVIYYDGEKRWLVNGKLHRLDGPAIIRSYYSSWWYKNGKMHRSNGPAIEYFEEHNKKFNEWYVDGRKIM